MAYKTHANLLAFTLQKLRDWRAKAMLLACKRYEFANK